MTSPRIPCKSDPTTVPRITRDELLTRVRELAQTHGESLTLATVIRETGLSRTLLLHLCGSWSELRAEIRLTAYGVHSRKTLSDEVMREKLWAVVAEHGENVSQARFSELSGYSSTLIMRRFGSWGQLRKSAGLTPRAKMENHYTDEEIFDDMMQVVVRIHRKPTFRSYKRDGGKISAQTISDRFGSWEKVIYAYEDEMDRRSSGPPQPRYRPDPRNPLVYYVFLGGKPLYYIEYDSTELTTGTKTPLPEGFTM